MYSTKCKESIDYYEPTRNPTKVATMRPVKCLAKFLSELKISNQSSDHDEQPQYDPQNLAEVLIYKLLECKDLDVFKDYMQVFSLGADVSKLIFEFIESLSPEIVQTDVPEHKNDESAVVESSFDSDCDDTSDHSRELTSDEYFDETTDE